LYEITAPSTTPLSSEDAEATHHYVTPMYQIWAGLVS
jgi:hypothetical protein